MSTPVPLDPAFLAIVDTLKAAGWRRPSELTPERARAQTDARARPPAADDPVTAADRTVAASPPVPVRVYTPPGAVVGTVVYLHGGGWVAGSIASFDHVTRALARAGQRRVVSVEYRLSPESRYPDALDDGWAALTWAAEQFPGELVVAGDSAGGNLAALLARRARGRLDLSAQLLFYPVTDHDFARGSYDEVGEEGLLLTTTDMRWYWDQYLPDVTERDAASPLRAGGLGGLPTTVVVVAGHDPLRDEGEAYATAARSAGTDVTVVRVPELGHAFLAMVGAIPAVGATIDAAFAAIPATPR